MKFWKELQQVFAARAASVRFAYQYKTVVNRKMRRSADAQLRHKPRPGSERIKLLNDILSAPRNVPARAVQPHPLAKRQGPEYIPQPRKRTAA